MEARMAIDTHLLVGDVMTRWPVTIRVFLDFRLGCVGCPIASFHSVDDACREHGVDQASFVAALNGAVG
jgi:hybrid cluster-associated redox disulfide protein